MGAQVVPSEPVHLGAARLSSPVDALVHGGTAIRRFVDLKMAELLPNARWMEIGGFKVKAVNCPSFLASYIANKLAEKGEFFGAAYADSTHQRVYSLRSIGEFDVSAIAKAYGGGGHKNAAGFQPPDP